MKKATRQAAALIQEQKSDPFAAPCVIEDWPDTDYHAFPAASSHALMTILSRSPLHLKQAPYRPTQAMTVGTLAHALLLEPARCEQIIRVKPPGCDHSSNAARLRYVTWLANVLEVHPPIADASLPESKRLDFMIEALELQLADTPYLVCAQTDFDAARAMRDAVFAKAIGRVIFDSGRAEVSMLAVEPVSGELCKIRCDWLPDGHDVIVDLKTAESVAFEDFARSAARYQYHVQAAFYRHIESLATQSFSEKAFLHVVVESSPPYDCAFWELDEAALDAGKARWQKGLDLWAMCRHANRWPGVGWDWGESDYRIEKLSLPRWAL